MTPEGLDKLTMKVVSCEMLTENGLLYRSSSHKIPFIPKFCCQFQGHLCSKGDDTRGGLSEKMLTNIESNAMNGLDICFFVA